MQDFLDWVRKTGSKNIVWITDVDETLLEKSTNPNLVTQVSGLESLCENLDKAVDGGFYVITGRDFAWLDQVFPAKNVRASCEYHCVFRKEAGAEPEVLNPMPKWNLIDTELEALVAQHEGLLLRKKDFMRSLHYVAISEDERETVKSKLQVLLDKHNAETGQSVGMVDGGKVFDMGPSDSDKGDALNDILQQAEWLSGKKLVPVYFGDSPGDLPGAQAAQAAGGKFISVGDDERVTSIADFHLRDPAEYRAAIKSVVNVSLKPAVTPTTPKLL